MQVRSTPLHWAAFAGNLDCVRLLLKRGAQKEVQDEVCCGHYLSQNMPQHRH
jgi:hypothetical protein